MKFFARTAAILAVAVSFVSASGAHAAIPRNPDYPKVIPFCWGAGEAVFDCTVEKKITFDPSEYGQFPPSSPTCDPPSSVGRMESCVIGSPYSDKKIAVVGSSHARLLWGAYDILGDISDSSVHLFLMNGCHFMVTADPYCSGRNLSVKSRILAGEFDLVIFAQRVDFNLPGDEIISATNYYTYYNELKRARIPFTVIKDNPVLDASTMKCFKKKKKKAPTACTIPRATAFRYRDFAVDAATSLGIPVIDFSDIFCNLTACPMVRGGMSIYADSDHITPGFGRTLGPFLWSDLRRLDLLP